MRIDKWAVTAQEALQAAIGVATDANASQVEPIHLLKALLGSGERNLSAIVERVGADPHAIEAEVDRAIAAAPKVTGGNAELVREEQLRQVEELLARAVERGRGVGLSDDEIAEMLALVME